MTITKSASAGTLESSDIQVIIEPAEEPGLHVSLSSSVLNQYGRQIRQTVVETLERLEITDANIILTDKGALDCTIKARVECAAYRALGVTEDYPWEEVIRP